MWYFKANQIRNVHFEISNFCNARCPECPREDINEFNSETGVNRFSDWIDTHFLSLDTIKKNFNRTLTPQLQAVSFCGCFGDALTHPKLIDILEYLIDEFPYLTIYLHTNGGLKTTSYWKQLAEVLIKSYHHEVIWGLDGLEDTNHIYRVNVKWEKVKANWKAFNAAGGNSHWQFIVFPHNHHQIDAAKKYAKQEGFTGFKTVLSMRYSETKAKDLPKQYQHPKITNNIEENFTNIGLRSKQLMPDFGSVESKLYNILDNKTGMKVNCSSQIYHNVFVFSEGTVWPCNKLGAWRHPIDFKSAILENATNARELNSLHNYTIDQILDNNYFNMLNIQHKTGNYCTACVQECGLMLDKEIHQTRDKWKIEKL
jgi:molybdenum cofactor biosynthesis enzyme MoaA